MKLFELLIEARPFCVFDKKPMDTLMDNPGIKVVDHRGEGPSDATFMAALKTADGVLSGNDLVVNAELLAKAPRLKVVAKMGVGLDMIDIDAVSQHGTILFNTPGVNNHAVADHTFALLLAVARKIIFCDQSLRDKRWEHTKIMGVELWQKTMGIVGLGAIGRAVALRAKGFAMEIVAHDPYWPEVFAKEHRIKRVELDELLKMSDVVSLHAPLTPENNKMINASSLEMMKPSAILINAARGEIVDENDLYQALKAGKIAGAGLDVFENEPPADSPLMALGNVVVTPHTAAFTTEAMNKMNEGVVDQLLDYLNGKKPHHLVNPDQYKPFSVST